MPRRCENKCIWKIPGSLNKTCDKPCIYDTCKRHRKLVREGSRVPVACRTCHIIVSHSEAYLCKFCKSNDVQKDLVKIEKKQKQKKIQLLQELLLKVPRK